LLKHAQHLTEWSTKITELKLSQNASIIGGPAGHVVPPHRVTTRIKNDIWNLQSSTKAEYVFCHNDLSQQNIIVNPKTLKIAAIIDWEFAGYYPAFFEMPLYRRLDGAPGSKALPEEVDDTDNLLNFLESMVVRD
jgi:thiamine kinase-like enzyme